MRPVFALLLLLLPAGTVGVVETVGVVKTVGVHARDRVAPSPGAQPGLVGAPDSTSILADAREAQARFERIRVHHAPLGWWGGGGECDEHVGRFCLRYSSEEEGDPNPPWTPPDEAEAVQEARAALDSTLTAAATRLPGDAWIAGQRTWYRGNAGAWDEALEAARACRSPEPGWCDLLVGYALHHAGRIGEAREFLERGLAALSPAEQEAWTDLEPLVEPEVGQALRRLEGVERDALEARIWTLGDPLLLLQGNALRTEHLARHVAARIQSEARNPHAIRWGDDMTEILVRFGPEIGYERVRDRSMGVSLGPPAVSGRFSSTAKGVFPTLEGLLQTSAAGPEAFPPAVYRARSRHAPPAVPRIRGLQARTARLVRGDSLLLVAAWKLPDLPAWDSVPLLQVDSVGLFLLPETGGTPERVEVSVPPGARAGVAQARIPVGRWWMSLEAVDLAGGRGWRHRQGVQRPPLDPGALEFSDLVLLAPEDTPGDADTQGDPGRLEDHLGRMLPTDTVGAEARVEVAWEVYGSPPDPEGLRFVVRVERDERGWLRRAGEAIGLVSPLEPVEIRWQAGLPSALDRDPGAPVAADLHLRRVELDLGSLAPGVWRIEVALESAPTPGSAEGGGSTGTDPSLRPGARTRVVVVDR